MKVKFNRAALQEVLGLVAGVIPNRTPKPILQCLQITAEKDLVRICATDLEVGINYSISQVEVETEGQVIVPADKILSIIRESVDEVIELQAQEAAVHIRGGDSHFTIYGHDAGQYPPVPGHDGPADLTVELGKLQEGVELCIFAAAKESTRYALNGILWEVKGKKLTLVATDGRRLARSIIALESVSESIPEGRIIVPAKTMVLLDRIGVSKNTKVQVRFIGNQIILACEPIVISSNLVEGNFPRYEDIIPADNDKKLVVSTAGLLSAVRRAALLVNEDSKGIKMSLSKDSLVITSRSPEMGDAEVEMKVEYASQPMDIGFNPQFLMDVLRVIKAADFEILLGEPDRPGLIKSGSNFLYIVMPVNL